MRRALGRGLSQLIAEQQPEAGVQEVPIDAITANSRQPRGRFDDDALESLAASIREHGILQPLVVRASTEGRYELIAGERRWRASKLAELEKVPVIVRAATGQVSLELALVENVQREDINAMECARAYRRLIDEFGMTQETVATRVGKSRVAIANTLRLLKLPLAVQKAVDDGTISEGHARALLGFADESRQLALYRRIVHEDLSVRDIERIVRADSEPKNPRAPKVVDPDWKALGNSISNRLGAPVKLDKTKTGGRIVVEFFSDDELQGILDRLEISGE